MTKVLYIAFDVIPSPKGASTHISYFTKALTNEGYDVTLVNPLGKNQREEEGYLGAKVKRVNVGNGNFLERVSIFSEKVEEILRKNDYHIVQFRSIWEGLAVLKKEDRNYRTIYEANGFPSIELPYHYPALREMPSLLEKFLLQELYCLLWADLIICPSLQIKKYILSKGIVEDKITFIPNGVDTDLFIPSPMPCDNTFKLLYTGTLAPWQGLNYLLESIYIMKKQGINFKLDILSDKKSKFLKPLLEKASNLGIMDFLTFLSPVSYKDVPGIISKSHICLAPLDSSERNTLQGCCPLKILEYMASGRPVISSDIPCVRELIENGVDGILCNPENPKDLARNIINLSQNPEMMNFLAEKGLRKAMEYYRWDRIGESYMKGVTSLIL